MCLSAVPECGTGTGTTRATISIEARCLYTNATDYSSLTTIITLILLRLGCLLTGWKVGGRATRFPTVRSPLTFEHRFSSSLSLTNIIKQRTMSQYSFPILSDREVAQCLNELGMSATVEQLNKPAYEFVQPIYENLVTALTGISRCALPPLKMCTSKCLSCHTYN